MSNNKTQAITYFNDAGKLYKIKLYEEALELYKKAIEVDITFADAHFCLAKTYIRKKDSDNGIAHFRKFYHLIAEVKQGTYVLALSNILIEEGTPDKALTLTDDLKIQFSEQEIFDYALLLLANKKENQAIHTILQLNDINLVSKGYKSLLENKALDKTVIEKLSSENIIPEYYVLKNRIQKLLTAGIQHKEYALLLKEAQALIILIREAKNLDYQYKIFELQTYVLELQNILANQTKTVLKMNNLEYSEKLIGILNNTKYSEEKLLPIKQLLEEKEKDKTKKITKITIVGITSAVIVGLAIYFGYNAYEKASARDYTLNHNSIEAYSNYLNKYGNDPEIDKLREKKLYEKAIETNNGNDFNELSRLYSNSEYLRLISVEVSGNAPHNKRSFGLGNRNQNIDVLGGRILKFKAPIGAKVGYSIKSEGMIPIERVFEVREDLEIKEYLSSYRELLFSEEFDSNANNWTTFHESKLVYGKTKNKGVNVSDNELQIYNELNENKFVISSINLSGLDKNLDFEIEASITRNNIDKGTFLLFGATKRAFNYIGFDRNSKYLYGYNNWDNSNDNWVKLSNGWKYNRNIQSGNYATNVIKLVKQNENINIMINNNYIGSMPLKRWYGSRIGFGINQNTSSKINYLKIYKYKNRIPITFIQGKTYFCWVDELNVRENATKTSEIITTIKLAEPVKFKGGTGNKFVNATFKGIACSERYYEVELLDGTSGWVHGGALVDVPSNMAINFDTYKK